MDASSLPTTPFKGTVVLHDWTETPWSAEAIKGFSGDIELIAAKDVLGTDVNSRDSNWLLRVSGEKTEVYILGCQVRLVWNLTNGDASTNHDFFTLP